MTIRSIFFALLITALPGAAANKMEHLLHLRRGTELFNGKDLTGWQWVGSGGPGFTVRDHLLETTTGKGILWYTGQKFGNAMIRVVYKMSDDKGNSGVFIRIPSAPPSEDFAINKGIEVQIDNRDNDWHCTGVLYSMTQAMSRPYVPAGQWNTMEILLDGLRTVVRVNGSLVTSYDGVSAVPAKAKSYEPDRGVRPESGYIALQHHDNNAVFSFKEVSVRMLKK
ncbi:MAG: 3-keto-disaccharide hydrolase [Bryobacteraceae bacterium]